MIIDLSLGNYTAVVKGTNGGTGVALVEAFGLESCYFSGEDGVVNPSFGGVSAEPRGESGWSFVKAAAVGRGSTIALRADGRRSSLPSSPDEEAVAALSR